MPIIPGLKPITRKSQLLTIPRIFHVNFPDDLVDAIHNCKDDKAAKQIGIEWCIAQSQELKDAGAPVIHYYTMGDVSTFVEIAKKVY